ncbi:MAG: hypothetical protein ABI690_29640 [Chloroflexota bacterium]
MTTDSTLDPDEMEKRAFIDDQAQSFRLEAVRQANAAAARFQQAVGAQGDLDEDELELLADTITITQTAPIFFEALLRKRAEFALGLAQPDEGEIVEGKAVPVDKDNPISLK